MGISCQTVGAKMWSDIETQNSKIGHFHFQHNFDCWLQGQCWSHHDAAQPPKLIKESDFRNKDFM